MTSAVLNKGGGITPPADFGGLEKPLQSTLSSSSAFQSKAKPVCSWKALWQSYKRSLNQPLLGSKATTNFLPNGSCQAAKMPVPASDTASIEDFQQSLCTRCAEPQGKMIAIVHTVLQHSQETC